MMKSLPAPCIFTNLLDCIFLYIRLGGIIQNQTDEQRKDLMKWQWGWGVEQFWDPIIIMMKKALSSLGRRLSLRFPFSSEPKIPEQRFSLIKNHTVTTEYEGLAPSVIPHPPNSWRLLQDDTNIKFLIEEGGFPGCSDMGILFKAGTQVQGESSSGSHFCLKNLVHMKPDFSDSIKNYEFLSQTGATVDFNYDVESAYLKCSFFEEDVDVMANLLLDLALSEKKLFHEDFQTEAEIEDMNELVRVVAFGGKGIGMPNCGLGQVLTNQNFLDFQRTFLTPHRTVISLSNLKRPEQVIASIKKKIRQNYPEFLARPAPLLPISNYVGGTARMHSSSRGYFEFAVAFPGAASKSPKMELFNILRVMLGSASSFSSGGPGKGMHSRCTKNMLNKEPCIESASFLLSHYDHFGLFGLTAAGPHDSAEEVVETVLREVLLLREVSEAELDRVKNMLVASIYSNIERQSDRLEELTKHINNYGRIKLMEFEQNIRKVTVGEIREELDRMFQMPPTFVVRGDDSSRNVGKESAWKKRLGSRS